MSNALNLLERPIINCDDPKATIGWLLRLCRTWQERPETAAKQLIPAGWVSVEFGHLPNLQHPRPTTSLSAGRPEWLKWLLVSSINLLLTEDHETRKQRLTVFVQDAEAWLASPAD